MNKKSNNDRILGHTPVDKEDRKVQKLKGEAEREQVRKRERKSLMKSLQLAQMSTASMGKFDKKAGKNEEDLNTARHKKIKKSNNKLNDIEKHLGKGNVEKQRNMNILNMMKREKEHAAKHKK